MQPSGNWIVDNLNYTLNYWNNTLNEIVQLVTQSPQNFRGGAVWRVIVDINGALKSAGFGLLVLFFCMGIFKSATSVSELKRPEAAVKIFIRFALSKAAITYCMDLMLALFNIGQGILTTVAGRLGSLGEAAASLPAEITQKINEVNFMESIPLWVVTLLGCLFIIVLTFIMMFSVYGRFFRLYMYTAIAPLPLSTFAGETTSNFGKAFLKSYAGVCIEGVVIVLACIIFSAFASDPPAAVNADATAVQAVWSYVIQLIFNLLVLVGAVKMSERLTKEILGL